MHRQPNIIWIVTTQWRSSAFAHKGDPNARTPWLDGLASEATDYTQAVTPHPFGPQARAALFTGKHCPENGVSGYWDQLPLETRTVANALSDRGYATAFFGKWHLAMRDREVPLVGEDHAKMIVPPANRGGFEFWEGFESGFLLNDPWLHGTRLLEPTLFKGYQADVLVQRTAEWIKIRRSRPFFSVISMESPHPPYHAPTPHVTKMHPSEIRLNPNVTVGGEFEEKVRNELAGYYAHIEATDRSIGKLVTEVDLTNTILVITSVHGDMHGAHGLLRKGWPYEENVRIPFMLKDFRSTRGKSKDDAPVSLVDLPHMSLAWADGHKWECRKDHALISMPFAPDIALQCDRAWRGLRTPKHKFILNTDGSPWLYFDLERDPFELVNLIGDPRRSGEVEKLRLKLNS